MAKRSISVWLMGMAAMVGIGPVFAEEAAYPEDKGKASESRPGPPPRPAAKAPAADKPFRPSEKIRADSAVSFPVDI